MPEDKHIYKKASPLKGKPRSAAICAKISAGKKGKKRKPFSQEWRNNIRKATTGKTNPFYGKHHTQKTKDQLSLSHKGQHNRLGKKHTEKTRQILRQKRQEQILSVGGGPGKGKHETELLNIYEKLDGVKINRNFTVIGYFPDGYCHETNTIYGVWEPYHFKQPKEDAERKQNIINELHCDYKIILDEDAAKRYVEITNA